MCFEMLIKDENNILLLFRNSLVKINSRFFLMMMVNANISQQILRIVVKYSKLIKTKKELFLFLIIYLFLFEFSAQERFLQLFIFFNGLVRKCTKISLKKRGEFFAFNKCSLKSSTWKNCIFNDLLLFRVVFTC